MHFLSLLACNIFINFQILHLQSERFCDLWPSQIYAGVIITTIFVNFLSGFLGFLILICVDTCLKFFQISDHMIIWLLGQVVISSLGSDAHLLWEIKFDCLSQKSHKNYIHIFDFILFSLMSFEKARDFSDNYMLW